MKVTIHTDGASRGNPGPAAAGAVIKDEKSRTVGEISHRLGFATNNQAEYIAVIMALEKAIKLGARQVVLKADSELVVKQLKGQYRVRNEALKPLHQQVIKLISSLDGFSAICIPREQNRGADRLANLALDAET